MHAFVSDASEVGAQQQDVLAVAAAHALHLLGGHRAVAVRAEREECRIAVLEATRAAAASLFPAAAATASHQHRD